MILFFRTPTKSVIATEVSQELASEDIQKLSWVPCEVMCLANFSMVMMSVYCEMAKAFC